MTHRLWHVNKANIQDGRSRMLQMGNHNAVYAIVAFACQSCHHRLGTLSFSQMGCDPLHFPKVKHALCTTRQSSCAIQTDSIHLETQLTSTCLFRHVSLRKEIMSSCSSASCGAPAYYGNYTNPYEKICATSKGTYNSRYGNGNGQTVKLCSLILIVLLLLNLLKPKHCPSPTPCPPPPPPPPQPCFPVEPEERDIPEPTGI